MAQEPSPGLPAEVAFHFNAVDKLQYAVRLLRKAHAKGARLHVLADAGLSARLDIELWQRIPGDFVPHCQDKAPPSVLAHSPIVIGPSVLDVEPAVPVLVNLGDQLPDPGRIGRYQRVIEVVSTGTQDRELARSRWRWYQSSGIEPVRHDLAASASGAPG